MKKELLSKKEFGLDGLGNFHPIWIIKDAKIKRFSVMKAGSERTPRVWLDNLVVVPQRMGGLANSVTQGAL